ncbi:MAG: PilZ domain-containing protein [Hyphomicrobiales bacterium]|nr:PilZ domain-containing protein [Hyphomicrobiales bacterium]
MQKDKRRSRRRTMRYHAILVLGPDALRDCSLSDISDTGARISVEAAEELPDRFTLLLSGNGAPQRTCRVVWRQPNQIGVDFEKRLPPQERVGLVPQMDADYFDDAAPADTAAE